LNGDDMEAARFKYGDYFPPARTVSKRAVNEHDVFDWLLLRKSGVGAKERAGQSHASREKNSRQNTFNDLLHRILLS